MSYRTPLETRLAKKTTKRHHRLQPRRGRRSGHGRPVGRQGQLGADPDPRRAAPARADHFSIVAVNVDSGYEGYQHKPVAEACAARGWEFHSEHTTIGAVIDDKLDTDDTPCSLCARLRRGVLYRLADAGRRHQDRARPPSRRLRRDAAAEPVLRRRAQGDAGAPGLRQRGARRDPAAGLRHRGRGARLRQGERAADHRLLLPGLRRPRACSASASSG